MPGIRMMLAQPYLPSVGYVFDKAQQQPMEKTMIEQRSPEWFATRCGKVTASRISDVLAMTKSGWSTSRANYCAQLVCERLTGAVEPSYVNGPMQWGIDKEPEALALYSQRQQQAVEEVGFVDHPRIPMSGASPDGLVDNDGLVEVKCPLSATHIDTLLGKKFSSKYVQQVMWQMACTNRAYCDLVSYDPRLPESMQLFIQRIEYDAGVVAELERGVEIFLNEVDEKTAALSAAFN